VIAGSWGLNWLDLPPGTYTVSFSHVAGCDDAPPQTITITAGQTTSITGVFTQRGTLRVTTNPPTNGTIIINGNPDDNWGVWSDFSPGFYQVCFGVVRAT